MIYGPRPSCGHNGLVVHSDVEGMRLVVPFAAVAIATLALAGCSNQAPAPSVDVPVATAPAVAAATPTSTAAPGTNERGNLVKAPGETAGWGVTNDDLSVKFVVDKITVDPKCTSQFASKSENGHLVQLDIRVETTATMPTNAGYSMNPYSWSAIGPDGVTESSLTTAATFSCLDSKAQLPVDFSPASKYRGSIMLDTSSTTGTLIFRPAFVNAGGWEWAYGV